MSLKTLSVSLGVLVALAPLPADAQRVSADIRVGTGPVSGTIHIGDRPRYYRTRPVVVVPERRARGRVVVVRQPQRLKVKAWRGVRLNNGRFSRDYRPARVIVYYEIGRDRFYDDYRPGLREVVVYQYNGGLYRDWDRNDYRGHEWNRDRDRDRDREWDRGRGGDRDRGQKRDGGRDRGRRGG